MISSGAAVFYSNISWLAMGGKRAWDQQSETLGSSPATNCVISGKSLPLSGIQGPYSEKKYSAGLKWFLLSFAALWL